MLALTLIIGCGLDPVCRFRPHRCDEMGEGSLAGGTQFSFAMSIGEAA
jgi:hypothetical protein